MTQSTSQQKLHFDPPGPGSWEIDPVHFPRPMTRYWMEIHPDALKRGVRDFTRFYGMLLDTMDFQYVNGFGYKAMVPLADAEVPKRFQRAEEVFAGKLWRQQLKDWDEKIKPASIARHRELQAIEPDELSDADLISYLARCREHHAQMISQHMRFTAAAMVPTGDFLAHVGDWTGLPPADLLGLLRGSAPVSAGASDELATLIAAVKADAKARQLIESKDPPGQVLDRLRAMKGPVGAAAAAYLDLVGNRLLDGFDISEPRAIELPDVLLRAIRAAIDGKKTDSSDVEARIAEVRKKVPEPQRPEFDELLGEARLTYRFRDERGVFSDIWASGIMRRAVLGAGRRLVAKGKLKSAEQLIDASFEEMRALISGKGGPTADELAARAKYRATLRAKDVPAMLGPPPPPPPDPSGLPPAAARMMRALGITMGSVFGSSEAPHETDMLRGLAASRGIYEGPARRVSSPGEFDRIQKGDVLVTESTTEAFNILLPLLGAIVTDSGGLLSHSAIVAREYGIPGVVGTREATARIADGARVRVDGNSGQVTVLG